MLTSSGVREHSIAHSTQIRKVDITWSSVTPLRSSCLVEMIFMMKLHTESLSSGLHNSATFWALCLILATWNAKKRFPRNKLCLLSLKGGNLKSSFVNASFAAHDNFWRKRGNSIHSNSTGISRGLISFEISIMLLRMFRTPKGSKESNILGFSLY